MLQQQQLSNNKYSPLIQSHSTRFAVYSVGNKPENDESEPVYSERLFPHECSDNPGHWDGALVEIRLASSSLDADAEDNQTSDSTPPSPFGVIYVMSFSLFSSVESSDQPLIDRFILEALLRARNAVAGFVFNCGGDKARDYLITRQRLSFSSNET